jgi:hypothetical protein
MWLHLIISVPLLVIFAQVSIVEALSSMAIGSLGVGIIVYSVLARPGACRSGLHVSRYRHHHLHGLLIC